MPRGHTNPKPIRHHDATASSPAGGLQLLSPPAAAAQLLTTAANLSQLRHQGRGPAYVKLGRSVVYLQSDLDAYIMVNRTVPLRS